MGWPTIIGLALTAAGTAASSVANSEATSAENKATDNQLSQQQALQKKATGLFNQNLPGNTQQAAQSQIGSANTQLQNQYKQAALAPLTPTANPINVSPVVQARADQSTQQQGAANAQNQGYSQWGVNQAIQNMLAGQQIGLVNNQASQLYGTYGANMNQAAQSSSGLSGIGSILGTLGTAVGVGGNTLYGKQPPLSYGTTGQVPSLYS